MEEQPKTLHRRQSTYRFDELQPTAFFPVYDEDSLVVTVATSANSTIFLQARILTPDNRIVPWQERFIPTTDRVVNSQVYPLPEGFILSIILRTTGNPLAASYATIVVIRGNQTYADRCAVLCQGQLSSNHSLVWPGGQHSKATDGRGNIRSITGTNPAAGVEISETVPTSAIWRPIAFYANLTTSATVANRNVGLLIDDGTNVYFRSGVNMNHAASLTLHYSFSSLSMAGSFTSNNQLLPFPPGLVMTAGHRLRTGTALLDAGDDWSAPQLLVEEWLLL